MEKGLKSKTIFSTTTVLFALLLLVLLFVLFNIGRVVTNSINNYDAYTYEQRALDAIKQESDKLKTELDYYSSLEYKKLYARDNLKLGEKEEQLIEIIGTTSYLEPGERVANLIDSRYFNSWWGIVFGIKL